MSAFPAPRRYFAARHGQGPSAGPLDDQTFARIIASVWDDLWDKGYFQEWFGHSCVDAGEVPGRLGRHPEAHFLLALHRDDVWPYWESHARWDRMTTLDMIEALYDLVSKPIDGDHHSYADCGWHFETFNASDGRDEYRVRMNGVLRMCDPAYELDEAGEIVASGPDEFRPLMAADLPPGADEQLVARPMAAAVRLFADRHSNVEDQRHALVGLAGVLEALRNEVKEELLAEDERALFLVANGFGVRHRNRSQKLDYDDETWLRWMFYIYLATIHAVSRVIARQRDGA